MSSYSTTRTLAPWGARSARNAPQSGVEFTAERTGEGLCVVFDVADDAYIDVEAHLAAAIARD